MHIPSTLAWSYSTATSICIIDGSVTRTARTSHTLASPSASGEPGREWCTAVVGAGPAGFYVTQMLAKHGVSVDLFEQLPAPFGLVRYGVAPDHADVKNVTSTFTRVLRDNAHVRLLADVEVGKHVQVSELLSCYDAVVLASGAASAGRRLAVPCVVSGSTDLRPSPVNVVTAHQLVSWYNGWPRSAPDSGSDESSGRESPVCLDDSVRHVVIVGAGNVALDVMRMLTMSSEVLAETDITARAVEALQGSNLQRVTLVARRAPQHAAFTVKELREQVAVSDWCADWTLYPYSTISTDSLPRARRRLVELMVKQSCSDSLVQLTDKSTEKSSEEVMKERQSSDKVWALKFLRRPLEYVCRADGRVEAVKLGINNLTEDGTSVVESAQVEVVPCQLVIESVGYYGQSPAPDMAPLDAGSSTVLTEPRGGGAVPGIDRLYACGWLASGPVGVIASTMTQSFQVARQVLHDLEDQRFSRSPLTVSRQQLARAITSRGARPVSFTDWQRLDEEEAARGRAVGKPREKIISIDEMRRIIWSGK